LDALIDEVENIVEADLESLLEFMKAKNLMMIGL